jgi:hypothetical protein
VGAVEDFTLGIRLAELVSKDPTGIGFLVTRACLQVADDVFWELVQDREVGLETLSEAMAFLRSYNARAAYLDAMKCERAWALAMIDYGAGNRKEFGMWYGVGNILSVLPGWAPDWLEEAQDSVNEWSFRFGPRGWFAIWKKGYCEYLDRALFRPDGVELRAITAETPQRAAREEAHMAERFAGCLIGISSAIADGAERALYSQARIELMLTALALEQHRRGAGRYPASLGELVPEYLPAVPVDFMSGSGEPISYRLKPDGTPLLYSVGANRTDDGGVPAGRIGDLDWVWQLTPTAGQSERQWARGEKR